MVYTCQVHQGDSVDNMCLISRAVIYVDKETAAEQISCYVHKMAADRNHVVFMKGRRNDIKQRVTDHAPIMSQINSMQDAKGFLRAAEWCLEAY